MGLKERRAIKEFQDTIFPGLKKKVDESAGFEVMMEIDWDSIAEADMTHMYNENLPQVYFEPVIQGFQKICCDDMGKEALRGGLKKIIIRNKSGSYSPEDAISFDGGALTIDHLPNSNVGYVKERADVIVNVISKKV